MNNLVVGLGIAAIVLGFQLFCLRGKLRRVLKRRNSKLPTYRQYTREEAIRLGIPIAPEAVAVCIYGLITPTQKVKP